MYSIIKKEFVQFFSSFLGVGILLSLFILLGLYTWVLEGNLLEFGFAEMTIFFNFLPWFLLVFIPVLVIRLFAEEEENKSMDLIRILPISSEKIYLGKILGAFAVSIIILFPTLLYVYSIKKLSINGELDYYIVFGQYIAIMLLSFTFIQIASVASLFTKKQSVAFVLGLASIYIFWQLPSEIKSLVSVDMEQFGLKPHFDGIGKGVLTLSDLLYFIGINLIFLVLGTKKISKIFYL